jgi:bacterioferritin
MKNDTPAPKGSSKASKEIMQCLDKIFQAEMSGIIRYLHYSFMVLGYNRIPIQKWFRDQAGEGQAHAIAVGEKITSYGGHPPQISAKVEESHKHSIQDMLEESLRFEQEGLGLYKQLTQLAADAGDIALEELARAMVLAETDHIDEVIKMLRRD